MSGLYLRLADTFERVARLSDEHGDYQRRRGRSDANEVAHAERAREAAERARNLAAQLR